MIYNDKGDYTTAELLYRRALTIQEKTLGPEHLNVAATLNNLASLYADKGDVFMAEPLYQRVLTIWEKALGPQHLSVNIALNNLALLYQEKGDHAAAESLHKRVLAALEKLSGPEHEDVAFPLYNLALLHTEKGDYAAAEPLQRRALIIWEKTLGTEHTQVASSLDNLALLHHIKGDYATADLMYKRALAIKEKAFGTEHQGVIDSLNGLAALHRDWGNNHDAYTFQQRAISVSESTLRRNLVLGSERQKLAYLTMFEKETNQSISFHAQFAATNADALRLAFSTLLTRKGRSLDAVNDTLGLLRRYARPEDQPFFDQLASVRRQLSALTLRSTEDYNQEGYRDLLQKLTEQEEKLESELSARGAEFRVESQPVTLRAVQKTLSANTALVEFALYRPWHAQTRKDNPPRYIVYVLTNQGEPRWAELGAAAAIDQQIEALRLALRNPKRTDYQRLARRLDKLVMEPVRKLLGGKTQLLLSPDGMLNLLPFAALVDESGKYLIERYKLTYLSSGRDLLRLQIKQQAGTEALVLGNPDFEQAVTSATTLAANKASTDRDIVKQYGSTVGKLSESVSMEQMSFRPLPGTAGEASALRALLPTAQVLTGSAATESALKQLRRPRLLHIATHGYFLKDLALPQRKQSDTNGPRLPERTADGEKIENPLLRSGLALAGANKRKSGEEDGILTALEAAGLDLWGTKLVVLSACDTGVGEVKNGEGVYGLRRAFVLAGSESQVMSLWSVSDQGTKELMVEYYKRLLRGEGRGEALRQVQLQMLKNPQRRHPYYWASFI